MAEAINKSFDPIPLKPVRDLLDCSYQYRVSLLPNGL
jgi:hypothetical protein